MKKVLVVCLGNICRSPMAHGLLRDRIEEEGIDAVVDSRGTGAWHVGESPDARAQMTMRQHGHEIADLRGEQFTVSDFDAYDEIYAMDQSNYSDILAMARNESDAAKVRLFLSLIDNSNAEVPDPYYGGDQGFESVYDMLSLATEKWLEMAENG